MELSTWAQPIASFRRLETLALKTWRPLFAQDNWDEEIIGMWTRGHTMPELHTIYLWSTDMGAQGNLSAQASGVLARWGREGWFDGPWCREVFHDPGEQRHFFK